MARRSGHRFNLMLMRRDALQSYASWLFPLLDAAEIDTTGYSARDKRVHGFLAERLLDVWLAQQDYRVKELPVAHLERQHWGRKIAAFLLRKWASKTTERRGEAGSVVLLKKYIFVAFLTND